MSQQQQRAQQQRKGGSSTSRRRGKKKAKQKPVDLWRPVPPLPEVEPIVPAGDPTALVRSLGEAPLSVPGAPAEITVAAVVDRAAGLALALAAAGGLLAEQPTDDD
ncbi:MAG: hypothetical protein JXA83_06920 [Acidimicrobiales bacterium]|nr:hypothetical protein [Acidimicrobiales bacterium]